MITQHEQKVDVLFVNPPSPDGFVYIRDINRHGRSSWERMIWPQTSLAYLAAVADKMGLAVDIVDCIAEEISWNHFEGILRHCRPRFCFSNIISVTYSNDLQALRWSKRISHAITVGMGPHLTQAPERSLQEAEGLDFIIRHEAEETLKELLETFLKGPPSLEALRAIKGLAFVPARIIDGESRTPIVTEQRPFIADLDSLPWPRHDLLPLEKYWSPFFGHYTFIEASRGCAYRCIFCRQAVMWQWKYRQRSGEAISREALYVHSLGVDTILFHADTFTLDPKLVEELCDNLIAAGAPFRWACNSHVKNLLGRPELVRKMRRAGCWMIAIGIESGDDETLRIIKKQTTTAEAASVVTMIAAAGIEVWGYFVLGFPNETKEKLEKTIAFSLSLPLKIAKFDIAAPYPGTEFHQYCLDHGYLKAAYYEEFDQNASAVVEYPDLSRQEIKAAVRRANRRFYLRPKVMGRLFRTVFRTTHFRTLFLILRDQLRLLYSGPGVHRDATACAPQGAPPVPDSHRRSIEGQKELHRRLSDLYRDRRYAPGYSRFYQRHWNRMLCRLTPLPAGSRVLDYGCGTGILFPELLARGFRVTGLDLSLDMLQAGDPDPDVSLVCGDGTFLPLADASFDAVFCRGSIHHLPDRQRAFREMVRILKPGGYLIFSEPFNDSPFNRLARRIMYRHSGSFHEDNEGLRRRPILKTLDALGMKVDHSRGFGFFAYTLAGFPDKVGLLEKVPGNLPITRFLIGLDAVLESLPLVHLLALHWMVRARKG